MNVFLLVVLGVVSIAHHTHSYVFVQVRKGDNQSDVDALIHKVIPSGKIDKINNVNVARKQFNNFKRFEVRKRADDERHEDKFDEKREEKDRGDRDEKRRDEKRRDVREEKRRDDREENRDRFDGNRNERDRGRLRYENSEIRDVKEVQERDDKKMESVVVAIDTGAEPDEPSKTDKPDMIDKIEQVIKDLGKNVNQNSPFMRAREEYNIKPEMIHFRSGKPSLKFELNSESIIKAVQSLLSSRAVRRYADDVAQKAAVVFKVINEELQQRNPISY